MQVFFCILTENGQMLSETSKFNLNLGNILNITKNNLCRSLFLNIENFTIKDHFFIIYIIILTLGEGYESKSDILL